MDNYLDYAVSQELEYFEDDLETFWEEPDVKFFEYVLKRRKKDENGPEKG
jgi:hypothetical protein